MIIYILLISRSTWCIKDSNSLCHLHGKHSFLTQNLHFKLKEVLLMYNFWKLFWSLIYWSVPWLNVISILFQPVANGILLRGYAFPLTREFDLHSFHDACSFIKQNDLPPRRTAASADILSPEQQYLSGTAATDASTDIWEEWNCQAEKNRLSSALSIL